jgi:DNA primase
MSGIYDRIKETLPVKEAVLFLTGLTMKGPHLEKCPFCGHRGCFSFHEDGFRCFSCDAKGDLFNFLEKYEGLTPKEALERAASIVGISLPSHSEANKESEDVVEPPSIKDKIFAAAADYYHARWREGRAYFIEARKHAERTVEMLKAGWSDGGLFAHLKAAGFDDADILASGLVVERTKKGEDVWEDYFFKDLAVYPHYSQGCVVHFTCKDPEKRYELQLPKSVYICPDHPLEVRPKKGNCRACEQVLEERPVRGSSWMAYNEDQLFKRGELIFVEGENDLMSLFDAGFHNVIALCGNPSDERVKRIVSHCSSRHVYLCFDNDEGGRKYTRKFARALIAEGAIVRIIVW